LTYAFHIVVAESFPGKIDITKYLTDKSSFIPIKNKNTKFIDNIRKLNVDYVPTPHMVIWPKEFPDISLAGQPKYVNDAYLAWFSRCARFSTNDWNEFIFCLKVGLFMCCAEVDTCVRPLCRDSMMQFVRCLKGFTLEDRTKLYEFTKGTLTSPQ